MLDHQIHCQYFSQEDLLAAGCLDIRMAMQATEEALAESIKTGKVKPITTRALAKAAKGVKPSIGAWMETARNHATFGNVDGMYDELSMYLRKRR